MPLTRLVHRALLAIRGADRIPFLQGLLSNDVRLLEERSAIAAFMLNTKGRIVEDLLLHTRDDQILVECSSIGRSELKRTFERYKMRKRTEILEVDETVAHSSEKGDFQDPRTKDFGFRVYGASSTSSDDSDVNNYHAVRQKLGIAEGIKEVGGLLPFQANGDLLGQISLDKGCYIGQELTARTAHTGVIRRRILPFTYQPSNAELEDEIKVTQDSECLNGRERGKAGHIITNFNGAGLALISLSIYGQKVSAGGVNIELHRPPWMPESIFTKNEQ